MSESKSNLRFSIDEIDDDSNTDINNEEYNKKKNKNASNLSLKDEENVLQRKLHAMDENMEDLLHSLNSEINWNDIIRGNTMNLNKYRYLIPDIRKIQDYKRLREKKIKKHCNKKIPLGPDNSVYGISESILNDIDLNKNITPKDIFYTLLRFYKNQISNFMNESELLISRWIRFCSEPKPNELEFVQELFENAHSIIYANLRDSIMRYTNLHMFNSELKIKLKNKMNITSKNEEEVMKEKEKIEKEFYNKVDFKLGYDITDFLVYIRYYMGKIHLEKPLQWYFIIQKLIVKSEMFDLLRNYEILKSEKNLYLLPESFQSLTTMTNEIPLKLCSYQSFFKKCSSLLYHFNIDTSITAEDGRRLAYEIDFYFNELFNDHLINIQAYLDKSKEKKKEKENEKIGKKNDDQKFDTEEPHNKFFINMPPCVKIADWIDEIQINPEFSDEYYSYNEWLIKEKEFDYELKLNYEIVKINNLKRCILKLQDMTKLRFREFSNNTSFSIVDKKSPLNNSEIKPQFELKRNSSENSEKNDDHDYSMHIENKDEKDNSDVFKSKLEILEDLEKKKSDDKTVNLSNAVAEYELFEYFQLRHLRIRELRYMLLNQFNYLRSIEKRLTCDIKELNKRNENDLCDDLNNQRTYSFSEFEENLKFKKKNINRKNYDHKPWFYRYDNRKVDNNEFIKLIDNKGREFIYDVAYDDLINREKELLKIGTCYLNVRSSDQLIEYNVDIKEIGYDIFKDQEIKNSTYLNPKYDRAELLFELYENETKYQNTKINLINCYLEIYENTTNEEDIQKIAQIITNLIHIKPLIHNENKYFSYLYFCEIKSMENHLNLIKNILLFSVEKTKLYYTYIASNVAETDKNRLSNEENYIHFGIPRFNRLKNKYYPISMHYPDVTVNITDIYPNLGDISNIVHIQENLNEEFINYYKIVYPKENVDSIYVKCLLWDLSYKRWISLLDSNFEDTYIKKNVEKLFDEKQLEDLQIPDLILENMYSDFVQNQEENAKDKNVNNYYKDLKYNKNLSEEYENSTNNLFVNSEFNYQGKDILLNYLKMISSRNKLLYSWIETEYCREIYNKQIYYMKVSVVDEKYEKINMFNILGDDENTDNKNSNSVSDEMKELNSQTVFKNDVGHEVEEFRNIVDDIDFFTVVRQAFKPLVYNELVDEDEEFALPSYNNTNKYINPDELEKILQALKLQQLEEMNYEASINLHKYSMKELYPVLINEYIKSPPSDIQKRNNNQKVNDFKRQKRNIIYNISYNNIVFTTTTEKLVLKIIVRAKWKKFNENYNKSENNIEENIQERNKRKLQLEKKEKDRLIEWFSRNYLEIIKEMYYKLAYVEKVVSLKNVVSEYSYGKMIFQISKYENFSEYFKENADESTYYDPNVNNNEEESKANNNDESDNKNSFQNKEDRKNLDFIIQTLRITDDTGKEPICYLWYIPSILEIIMDNKIKQYSITSFLDNIESNVNIFSQKTKFSKALKLNGYIKDIFELTSNYGWFLQRNTVYRITNNMTKQSDYVLANFTDIKEKLSSVNEVENYDLIENKLHYEWRKYKLLMKAFKSLSIDVLYFNGLLNQVNSIIPYCKLYLFPRKEDKHKINIWKNSYPIYKKKNDLISINIYYKLSLSDKKLCDLKISKMEEVMHRKFSNGKKHKNEENDLIKITEIEYLEQLLSLTGIRLEYYRIRMKNVIKIDFEKSKVFFKFYKNDILFNSIRLFYKNDSNQREYSEIIFDTTMELKGSETSYAVQILFEQYQINLMKDDLSYYYTLNLFNYANILIGKIHNLQKKLNTPFLYQKESIIFSNKSNPDLNVYMTQEEFDYKYYILNNFINKIYHSDKKIKKNRNKTNKNSKVKIKDNSSTEFFSKNHSIISNASMKLNDIDNNSNAGNNYDYSDNVNNDNKEVLKDNDSIIEISKKDFFRSIDHLACNMFEWEQERQVGYNKFFCGLQTKMNDMFYEYEQQIKNMEFEKRLILAEYDCEVKLESANANNLIVIQLKKLSKAIEEQKENYKLERKKIKEKITNEYKELVQELVEKFLALKQQFSDYRMQTKQETIKIMNESKVNNLRKVIKSEMMPDSLVNSSRITLSYEEKINSLNEEINELKYTNMKMRAFFMLLINKINMRCKLEKQNLKQSFKKTESTLWKSYSDFKLRDDELNDELRKARKDLIYTNIENEKLKQRVKDLNQIIESYKIQLSVPSDRKKVISMKKKIQYYKNLNIIEIINELNQKTNLVLKLSEKLKQYTDEEVVTESDLNNDILRSIHDLLSKEAELNEVNEAELNNDQKDDYDKIKDTNEKNKKPEFNTSFEENVTNSTVNDTNYININYDDYDKILLNDKEMNELNEVKEMKNENNRSKKPVKEETAKSKIHRTLYGKPKTKRVKTLMSYHNNPLSINEDKLQKDIEKMKRNEYHSNSNSLSETPNPNDNNMTKDNYLDIIGNLIKENNLLRKKITEHNINQKSIKKDIVNVNEELYNIKRPQSAFNDTKTRHLRFNSTNIKSGNIIQEKRFNNSSRYPQIINKNQVSKNKNIEVEDINPLNEKLILDFMNKKSNDEKNIKKSKTKLKNSVSNIDNDLSDDLIINYKQRNNYTIKNHNRTSSFMSDYSHAKDNDNKKISIDYENGINNVDSLFSKNKEHISKDGTSGDGKNNNSRENNNGNGNGNGNNGNDNNEEIQKTIDYISRIYGIQQKSRLPPNIRKMYSALSFHNDNNN